MNKPTVSVIIPCYNSGKFIDETIDSVLNQTYENIVIIAIDDGSTDNTREILNKYKGHLTVLAHENDNNRGVAASLNLGLKQANTDLIAFIDHDDIWFPDKIQRQVDVFEHNSDVDLVYTNGEVMDSFGKKLYNILDSFHSELNDTGRLLLECYIKSCSNVMITRRIIDKVGMFNEKLLATDHDMWLRIMEISKFYYIPECLIGYRVHDDQNSYKRKLWEDGFCILNEAIKRYPYPSWKIRKRLAVLHYRLGEYGMRMKTYGSAICHYLMAFWYDPLRTYKQILKLRQI